MNLKYNTVVIGGGLAGLVAGGILTKFGKKVLLLEQHYKPGGCATTFKRGDFVIEVGLHEMCGHDPGNSLKTIFNMLEVDKRVKFLQVPELYALYINDKKLVFPHGYDAATKALVDRYPEDEKGIKRFMKVIAGIRKDAVRLPRDYFKSKLIYPLMPLLYPSLVEASRHTLGSWLDKYINNEQLKLELAAHVSYFADDPYKLSMFYFGLPQSSYISGGGFFIQGGSQKLSDHLAAYIRENGGTVLLGKKAVKIITENDRATAVTFADSFNVNKAPVTIECDNVVANSAIPLVADLLDKPYSDMLRQKIAGKTISCSLICLYLGFKTDVSAFGVSHYSNEILGEDVKTLKDVHANQEGSWTKRSFIFVDYGRIDAQLAPPGKSVGAICGVDYLHNWDGLSDDEYKAKKEEVKEILLKRLEKQFPGILTSIEYAELATPKTMQHYTLNPEGTPYGFTQSKQQSAMKRLRNNFLIPNLYFASAWAFPGGGFEGSMMAGFLVALQMDKDQIWSKSTADKFIDDRIVKLNKRMKIDDDTIELSFTKPKDFQYQKGQHAVLQLINPKVTKIDLPYRWLPVDSSAEEENIRFRIKLDESSFSKSCEQLLQEDKALVFGPLA